MEIWKIYVDLIWTPTVLLHSNERSFSTAELLTYEATDLGSQRKFKIVSISILKCYPAHLPALHINEDHGFVFLPPLVKAEQVDSFQIRDAEKDIINWPAIDFSAVPRRSYKSIMSWKAIDLQTWECTTCTLIHSLWAWGWCSPSSPTFLVPPSTYWYWMLDMMRKSLTSNPSERWANQ